MELIIIWSLVGLGSLLLVDKGVEARKHTQTAQADKYSSCVKASGDPRECRGLEAP